MSYMAEHPIVALARNVAKRGTEERFVFDARAEAKLERALLDHADDPTLPVAVNGLVSLATSLYEREDSPSAGKAILAVLTKVRPQLNAIRLEQATSLENAARAFNGVRRDAAPPLAIGTPPSESSVKASTLNGFSAVRRRA